MAGDVGGAESRRRRSTSGGLSCPHGEGRAGWRPLAGLAVVPLTGFPRRRWLPFGPGAADSDWAWRGRRAGFFLDLGEGRMHTMEDYINVLTVVKNDTRSLALKAHALAKRAITGVEAVKEICDVFPEYRWDPAARVAADQYALAKEMADWMGSAEDLVTTLGAILNTKVTGNA